MAVFSRAVPPLPEKECLPEASFVRCENRHAMLWSPAGLCESDLFSGIRIIMRVEDLEKLVAQGESEKVEFKKSTGQCTEAAKAVCAMLNGHGGVVVFGVSDRAEIVGQQVSAKTLEDIACELRNIEPAVMPEIETVTVGDNKTAIILGHAFSLLRHGEGFLFDRVPIAGRVVPGKMVREDYPLYPPLATREAIANAICHRDYTIHGGAVALAMYDDRLEVINPGILHFGITPEKLSHPHDSQPWNPIIASVFYRAGIIERWGAGTMDMIGWCRKNGNPGRCARNLS